MIPRRVTLTARFAPALLAALLLGTAPAAADDEKTQFGPPPAKPGKPAAAAAGNKDMKDWSAVTKEAEEKAGLFRIFKKKDAWYLMLRTDQLDRQYLLALTVGRGIGSNFILGGLTMGEDVVRFRRKADQIQMVKDNLRFTASGDSALMRAVELSFAPSVAHNFKIESERGDSLLVDLGSLVLSDYADLQLAMKNYIGSAARIDDKKSTLGLLRVFPKNVEMEGDFTLVPGNREEATVSTVSDARFIPVTIRYSLSELPELGGYVPRLEDDRVGFFNTNAKDFSRDNFENYMVHYVNRWNLKKKDLYAAASEPEQPIVFYLENTIPEKWRPYVGAGIEEWNKAFEKAGFKNAIAAKPQPADSAFDAADVRYSTIRWITSSEPSFGAIGPSRVDPRTGQILDADILIEASVILGYRNYYRRWVGPETVEELLSGVSREQMERGFGRHFCSYGLGMVEDNALVNFDLLMDGSLPPGSPVPEEYIGQAVKALVIHEVGHTLGLRHNFQSSVAVPADKLGDPAYVEQNGMTGSIMDYDTPFISKDPGRQKYYYSPTVGPYDLWAIRYGYTPTAAKTPWDEKEKLDAIAAESTLPGRQYGTDEDTYPADALDPRNNIYDLGDDPLGFGEERAAYLAGLWSSPRFEERILAKGDGFPVLRRAADAVLVQYTRALSHGLKYIGGQQVSRAHYGDPGAPDPFTPVPAAKQRAALAFLARRAFAPDAFGLSEQMLNRMGANRYWDWESNLFGGRIDYAWYSRVLLVQMGVLQRLTSAPMVARVREAESRSADPLTLAEMFDGLTGAIWGEFGVGSAAAEARRDPAAALRAVNGAGTRRELQRAYVDNLARWVVDPAPPGTDDARALARLHLGRIDGACAAKLAAPAGMSDAVLAHLLETRARVKRALEAQRQSKG